MFEAVASYNVISEKIRKIEFGPNQPVISDTLKIFDQLVNSSMELIEKYFDKIKKNGTLYIETLKNLREEKIKCQF